MKMIGMVALAAAFLVHGVEYRFGGGPQKEGK